MESRARRILTVRIWPSTLLFWLLLLAVMLLPFIPAFQRFVEQRPEITSYWTTAITLVLILITMRALHANQEMIREVQRQRLSAVKPAILFGVDDDFDRRTDDGQLIFTVTIRNAGAGPALNVYLTWSAHQAGIGRMSRAIRPTSLGPGDEFKAEFSVERTYFHARMIEGRELDDRHDWTDGFWTELGQLRSSYRDVNMYFCESSARIDMVEIHERAQALPRVTAMQVLYRDTTV
ncbi:MAG: hypothetical protein H0W06_08540 [Chloroflexia bacterium]|nr:hypothetical protein [Chloroflexia bacterium]